MLLPPSSAEGSWPPERQSHQATSCSKGTSAWSSTLHKMCMCRLDTQNSCMEPIQALQLSGQWPCVHSPPPSPSSSQHPFRRLSLRPCVRAGGWQRANTPQDIGFIVGQMIYSHIPKSGRGSSVVYQSCFYLMVLVQPIWKCFGLQYMPWLN